MAKNIELFLFMMRATCCSRQQGHIIIGMALLNMLWKTLIQKKLTNNEQF